MRCFACEICGYVYDPRDGDLESGVDEGTDFEDLPEEWACPLCGTSKENFEPIIGSDDTEQ